MKFLIALCSVSAILVNGPSDFPQFTIDLSKRPRDRFKEPAAAFAKDIEAAAEHFV